MSHSNPEVIYLGTYSTGIYKTTNGGENWIYCSTENLPAYEDSLDNSPTLPCWWFGDYYPIDAIAVDPLDENHLWTGTLGRGLLESTDGGESWQKANETLPDTLAVNFIYINPQDPDDVLLGTGNYFSGNSPQNGGVYRTLNGGNTWGLIDSLPHGNTYRINSIARGPENNDHIMIGIGSNGEPGYAWGIMESYNNGNTWQEIMGDFRVFNISISPDNTQNIWGVGYTGFGAWWLMFSNDGGQNWELYEGFDDPYKFVFSMYADADFNLYIERDYSVESTLYSILKSEDNGGSWFEVDQLANRDNSPRRTTNLTNRFQAEPSNTDNFYFGTYYGVFHSEDGGITTQLQNTGLTNSYIREVEAHPFNSDIVYAAGTQGLWKSTDACRSWEIIHDDYSGQVTINPLFPDTLYCSMYSSNINLMRSYNGGITFENITFNIDESIADIAIHPISTNIVFTYGWSRLYKSTDYGDTWELLFSGLPYELYSSILFDPQHPDTMYFGRSRSVDGGMSWEENVLDKRIDGVHPQNSNILYGSSTSGDDQGNDIHVSYDWGLSFQLLVSFPERVFSNQNIRNFTISKDNPDYLFYCTLNDGIHYSTDAGATWQQFEGDYEKRTLEIIPFVDENKYYVATHGDGVWVYDPTYVSISESNLQQDGNDKIHIVPNPFRSHATICFETKHSGFVNISVYDMQGNIINTLINKSTTNGKHETFWNGKDLNGKKVKPGLYFLRLLSGRNTQTCKLILLK